MSAIKSKVFESPNQLTTYSLCAKWLKENQCRIVIVDKSETYRTKGNYICTVWYKEIESN